MHIRSFTRTLACAVVAFGLAQPAAAQSEKAPGLTLQSGKYLLDKSHASVTFKVKHLGFSYYTGRFNDIDATLTLDGSAPEKSTLEVTVKPGSVDTNNQTLEEKLKKEDAFNVEKFPVATFTSTSIVKTSETRGKVTGNLTLLGVTKPVELEVSLNGKGTNPFIKKETVGFSATGTIKRSDFGMTVWDKAVGDEVKLLIEVEFNRE